jgi:hypothetical protein
LPANLLRIGATSFGNEDSNGSRFILEIFEADRQRGRHWAKRTRGREEDN